MLLVVFCVIESQHRRSDVPARRCSGTRVFASGNAASLLGAIARGGLQFMLIIWLQGIWLPLHGYDYADTPLWAGIYLVPLTLGFLVAGRSPGGCPTSSGHALFASGGLLADGGHLRRACCCCPRTSATRCSRC